MHKFLVSLGLGSIVFAFALPWMLMKEKFDLYQPKKTLLTFTNESQRVIELKNESLYYLFSVLPYLSILLIIIGAVLIVIGIYPWWKKQRDIDNSQKLKNIAQELANKKLEIELQDKSPQEKAAAILKGSKITSNQHDDGDFMLGEEAEMQTKEVILNLPLDHFKPLPNSVEGIQQNSTSILKTYYNIEKTIIQKLEAKYSHQYNLVCDKKIAEVSYDILLLSKIHNKPDIMVGIHYRTANPVSLEETLDQLESMEQVYHLTTRRKGTPFIVFVVAEVMKKQSESNLKEYINSNKVILLTEQELLAWQPELD
ncbi:hypothetical protein IEC97_27940 [Neobacillus cucumis]|uniref:hypothetical protein n=1 Tax=Neobacillus cucumis TaxID=1740721 RepID=UPI0018DF05F5|nr:hypothetical protein [Neobacillus cucumis]MBI0581149.1 hypothetical protein [Neobacillus cucumis]